ncbi:PP2C family protein-serine/threonine phosphatase [uncultured Jatrophihabitans sp.]|uniref:PP2C family protein-serine/threonine phosphatase n=1 Tax=uncultured Jatrophihabitans sp. TaxID=1610747 RepID=UPI0035CBE558
MSILEVAGGQEGAVSVLLVEDDHGDAVLVQASLHEVGFPDDAVLWVRTMAEAKDAVAARRPRCVLLDLGLPDAEGYAAVQEMVTTAPDVAVIVLTGRQERNGADALTAGAQDYLVKDAIDGELLERSIRYAMERKRTQRAQEQLLEAELSAAEQARLERGLLPRPLVRTDAVGVATYYRPGRDNAVLGGDFFDVVETPEGRIRAVIGDVMGHGPDEAALGVHLRVAWRTLLLAGVPDVEILPNLSRLLDSEQAEHPRYVTACEVTIDGGELSMRVAGHPAPVLTVSDVAEYPDAVVGPPLGVRVPGGGRWPATTTAFPAGSSVVLYTDGLLEAYAVHPETDSLGIPELVEAVGRLSRGGEPATGWISELVSGAPLDSADDTAALVLTSALSRSEP